MSTRSSSFNLKNNFKFAVMEAEAEVKAAAETSINQPDQKLVNTNTANKGYDCKLTMRTRKTETRDRGFFSNLIGKLLGNDQDEEKPADKKTSSNSNVCTADTTPLTSDVETSRIGFSKKGSNVSTGEESSGNESSAKNKHDVLFIPCTNCHTHIHMDDIGKFKI